MKSNTDATEGSHTLNRLAILKKPKTGELCKPAKPSRNTQGKAHKPGRNIGKLNQLVKMPLDIIFEVAAHLAPLALIYLSRVSKHFRSVFMSRNSRVVWRAVLKSVSGLPECPQDLNEPQYASLLFERICGACSNPRAQEVYYGLRLRFCTPCARENMGRGSTLIKPYSKFKLPAVIFTLFPRALNYDGSRRTLDLDSHQGHTYYGPEVEMVIKRYISLRKLEDTPALDKFIKEQQTAAKMMMKHGHAVDLWEVNERKKRCQVIDVAQQRRESIEERMNELGWESQYFPGDTDYILRHTWNGIIDHPTVLTTRGWGLVRPKLEKIYQEVKETRLGERFKEQLHQRYNDFVVSELDVEDRAGMPHWPDAQQLPSLARLLKNHRDSDMEDTPEFWTTLFDSVFVEAQAFKLRVRKDLLSLITMSTREESQNGSNTVNVPPYELGPSSLFLCGVCSSPYNGAHQRYLGYDQILDHYHQHHPFLPWKPKVKYQPRASQTAALLLKALDLPSSVPQEDVDALDGRLVCLCGHPGYRDPMSFENLVRHFIIEGDWYKLITSNIRECMAETAPEILKNDHDLPSPTSCVAILSADADPTNAYLDETNQGAIDTEDLRCTLCYRIAYYWEDFKASGVHYHMEAKHGKELEDGDLKTVDSLIAAYGTRTNPNPSEVNNNRKSSRQRRTTMRF